MADTLNSISNFITSPPALFVTGPVLGGFVCRLFEKVESVSTDQTKSKIARWLRVRNLEIGVVTEPNWPDTFATIFDSVFTKTLLSVTCFWRSSLCSCVAIFLTLVLGYLIDPKRTTFGISMLRLAHSDVMFLVVLANFLPDYLSLLKTRWLMAVAIRHPSVLMVTLVLLTDLLLTLYCGLVSFIYGIVPMLGSTLSGLSTGMLLSPRVLSSALKPSMIRQAVFLLLHPELGFASMSFVWFYPTFFTSIWLWLYAGSGFFLKFARRFNIGFAWFNRHFDIEHKPLSAIGLVAGCIVALAWWAVVVVRWIV